MSDSKLKPNIHPKRLSVRQPKMRVTSGRESALPGNIEGKTRKVLYTLMPPNIKMTD